jgi:hypothetical protein
MTAAINNFGFADSTIDAIDANKKVVRSVFQGGRSTWYESFTKYPRDDQCGSILLISGGAGFDNFMSQDPGMCVPWKYGLPKPAPCE